MHNLATELPHSSAVQEVGTIVTDAELNVLAEGPSLAVKQPDALLDGMDEWNTRQHGQSGLTQRVRDSHRHLLLRHSMLEIFRLRK